MIMSSFEAVTSIFLGKAQDIFLEVICFLCHWEDKSFLGFIVLFVLVRKDNILSVHV